MPSRRLRPWQLAALVLAVLLVFWAIVLVARSAQGIDVNSQVGDQCDRSTAAERVVLTADDGTRLGGAVVGSPVAARGVVVNYGRSQTLCDWLGEAQRLAEATGSRVLVVDRRGTASSEGETSAATEPGDVATGVRWLRDNGATGVVVLGSSLGTQAASAAAADLDPKACAVVLVSPAVAGDTRAELLQSSTPVWMVTESQNATYLDNATTLLAESKSRTNVHLHQVATSDHSIALLENHEDARAVVDEAVAGC